MILVACLSRLSLALGVDLRADFWRSPSPSPGWPPVADRRVEAMRKASPSGYCSPAT
jgi:hypothetical protein